MNKNIIKISKQWAWRQATN